MANDNKSLGKFLLAGIPPAPRGLPQIEVSFEIDVNGILKVLAQDQGTGREQSILISHTGGLKSNEIERMRQEAERYAEEDRRRMRMMELRNQSDSLFYTYDTTLKENSQFIREELKQESRRKKEQLAVALRTPTVTVEKLQVLVEDFRQIILLIGTEVYQQANVGSVHPFETFGNNLIEAIDTQLESQTKRMPRPSSRPTEAMPSYAETSPVYQFPDDEGFDFDADETISSDYEAVD
jgi:molecular chaperone DnaK